MTFIVVSGHGERSTRSWEISYRQLRRWVIAGIATAALLLLMAVSWVWVAAQAARVPGQQREIRRLQEEVAQVQQLQRMLQRMEARNEQINTMLGGGVRVDTSAAAADSVEPADTTADDGGA
jgi:biopolymer transport protein ExbB/TolQ